MRQPVLTISVAAYNVGDYLERGLMSLCDIDGIEVLIVNDGSTDETGAIAAKFESKFPETFRFIDKPNGGYGSTVNRGLHDAKGKYFKILDGDDWFSPDALRDLVRFLATSDDDLILMPGQFVKEGTALDDSSEFSCRQGQSIDFETLSKMVGQLHMAVRTTTLKASGMRLPENCFYTDQIFTIQSLISAKTVRYFAEPVYCYRIGREGQSITKENRINHIDDLKRVVLIGNRLIAEQNPSLSNYVIERQATYYASLIKTYLLCMPSREIHSQLVSLEKQTASLNPVIFSTAYKISRSVRLARSFNYKGYWVASRLINRSWN